MANARTNGANRQQPDPSRAAQLIGQQIAGAALAGMNKIGSAPIPVAPTLSGETGALMSALEYHHERLAILVTRMDTLLRPLPPQADIARGEPAGVVAIDRVRDAQELVHAATRIVNDLLDRLAE